MENTSGNMGRNVTVEKILNFCKRIVNSTFLIVDERGASAPVKNFVSIAMIAASALLVSVTAAASFCFLYASVKLENIKLAKEVSFLHQRVVEIRDKKDILLAKLVLKEVESKNEDEPPAGKKNVSLAIKDFVALRDSGDSGRLKVRFHLIVDGISKKDDPLRALVVLKPGEKNKKKWLFFPDDAFDSGKPSRPENGFSYSTNSPDPIQLNIKNKKKAGAFKSFKVYLFDAKGELLSEKEFPMEKKTNR